VKITYILSNQVDYNLLICDDAGPGYANNMNWPVEYLNNVYLIPKGSVFVFDNHLHVSEMRKVEKMIFENPNSLFFLKVIDPLFQDEKKGYFNFLKGASKFVNTGLISVYEPREMVCELKEKYTNRFIHLPYPYNKEKELKYSSADRKNRIIISGSLNKYTYPYRYLVWEKVTRILARFIIFSILKHPGYAEQNPIITYNYSFTKDSYVKYLSGFKFMLLCPSRYGIELLKFHECAYAGCIPVGLAPDCYPNRIKKTFLLLRVANFHKDLFNIIFAKHDQKNILLFRTFLDRTRNPNFLNKKLKLFTAETSFPLLKYAKNDKNVNPIIQL
jgi:hypothetical protein